MVTFVGCWTTKKNGESPVTSLRKSTDDRPAATGANRWRWIWCRHASIRQDQSPSRRPVSLWNVGPRFGDGRRARRGLNRSPLWCRSLYLSFHRQHRRPTSLPSAVRTVKSRRTTRLRPFPPPAGVYAQRQWTVPGCGRRQPPGHRRSFTLNRSRVEASLFYSPFNCE